MTRKEAIDIVKCLAWHDLRPSEEDIEQAIKALEQEPILDKYQAEIDHLHKYIAKLETQITGESFINKPCVSEKTCEHDKNAVLDKIRAEIEQTVSRYSISRERGGMGQVEWSDRLIKESEVLQIIDKYKAESEG